VYHGKYPREEKGVYQEKQNGKYLREGNIIVQKEN
jgi:hypothetical protein|tara:strand:+ start:180 stop:284 length:105 start_codon:yes stop_codon:yes gene_type:complete